MRFDRSDLTALVVMTLAGGFAFVATGSTTLRTSPATQDFRADVGQRIVRVETRVGEQRVRAETRVRDRVRRVEARVAQQVERETRRTIEAAIEGAMSRPVIYVDGVLIEPSVSLGDLDPGEIRSVTVRRDNNEIVIETESEPEEARVD